MSKGPVSQQVFVVVKMQAPHEQSVVTVAKLGGQTRAADDIMVLKIASPSPAPGN